jgi:hypothetical protein
MKTLFKTIFYLIALLLVITTGTISAQAQRGRVNEYGERHFLNFGRGNNRHHEPVYRHGKDRY